MENSLLRFMLVEHPDCLDVVLNAIESGELDAHKVLAADPKLMLDALMAQESYKARRDRSPYQDEVLGRLFRVLDDAGGDPWQRGAGMDGFDWVLRTQSPALLDWLANHPKAPYDLTARLTKGSHAQVSPVVCAEKIEFLKALLDVGFSAEVLDHNGNSPLHLATSVEEVKLVLEAGVDPTIKNKEGHDARAKWGLASLPAATHLAMERELNLTLPVDSDVLIKEFGNQLVEIGVVRVRDRLKQANIDPATATYKGLSLPEIMVARALSDGLKMGSVSEGNHLSHRKWRRLLMASLKMSEALNERGVVHPSRIDALAPAFFMFQAIDLHLVPTSKLNPRASSWPNQSKDEKKDETRNDLQKMLDGQTGEYGDPQMLEKAFLSLEKMSNAGLIEKASNVAVLMLRAYGKHMFSSRSYMDVDGSTCPVFVAWSRIGPVKAWTSNLSVASVMYSFEAIMDEYINSTPLAFPVFLGFAGAGAGVPSERVISRLGGFLDEGIQLNCSDPVLGSALGFIEAAGKTPSVKLLASRVRAYAEEQKLSCDTAPVSGRSSSRPMRI